ncbi:hypothetical protein COCVIDRAFT_95307 [Bipolaris victoriae FI3]|uniref:Uncharacterized protein n=1 Tax=Bipolaris victoriae (strain FI3) TaxID=930091 RepID=W7EX04_BIPV3|nr:hypothetical protein COCVIDRAFT_95307 [Bipolaris victoriae FI3]
MCGQCGVPHQERKEKEKNGVGSNDSNRGSAKKEFRNGIASSRFHTPPILIHDQLSRLFWSLPRHYRSFLLKSRLTHGDTLSAALL